MEGRKEIYEDGVPFELVSDMFIFDRSDEPVELVCVISNEVNLGDSEHTSEGDVHLAVIHLCDEYRNVLPLCATCNCNTNITKHFIIISLFNCNYRNDIRLYCTKILNIQAFILQP